VRVDGTVGFLAGGGEMGARMRAHDWDATPLGAPEGWPQSLRTVVRILLTTNHPMFVFWGPDHICLYNDAYRASIGPEKHPAMLGARGRDMLGEIWHIIGPQIAKVLAGEGATWHEDQRLPIIRHGGLEEVYWTYSYSPIDDDASPNGVGGVLVVCTETTGRVMTERRAKVLLEIGDLMRISTDPHQVMDVAAAALGRHLGVAGVGYGEIDAARQAVEFVRDWTDGTVSSLAGATWPLEVFGPELLAELRAGRTLRIDDLAADPRPVLQGPGLADPGLRALLAVPLIRTGHLTAILFAHEPKARRWADADASLAEDVAARTWDAVERARAEAAERESERHLRAITDAIPVPIAVVDRREVYEFVNRAAAERMRRTPEQVVGRPVREIIGDANYQVRKPYIDRALAGEGVRFDAPWTDGRGNPRFHVIQYLPRRGDGGAVDGYYLVSVDITERRAAEEHRRMLIGELNHRVKNTLASVRAIANLTLQGATSFAEARAGFEGRLQALARTHDVLTAEAWAGADLLVIATAAVEHLAGGDRFRLDGPAVRLPPRAALCFAMVLHELATNAAKYGALSVPGGRVEAAWSLEEGGTRLRFCWSERGGPKVSAPRRQGFGSLLIQRSVAYELKGQASLHFDERGFTCRIEAPLAGQP